MSRHTRPITFTFHLPLPLFILLTFVRFVHSKEKVFLNKCPDFEDQRNLTDNSDSPGAIVIKLPATLTNIDKPVDFWIGDTPKSPACPDTFVKTVDWIDGKRLIKIKSDVRGYRLGSSSKTSTHFTHDADFHYDGHTFHPSQYCIKLISESGLQLQVCDIGCTGKTICIPKCCGVDEVLDYWKFTCRKINPHETKWKPKVHDPDYPHKHLDDKETTNNIHIIRHNLDCRFFDQWPLSEEVRAKNLSLPPDPISLWKILRNGRPIFLSNERKWINIPEGDYCVDGYANWGFGGDGNYSGKVDKHSVMLICPSKNVTGGEFSAARAWTYVAVLMFSSFFLLLTAVVHFLLLDRQHLHGLVVLSHSVSMYFLYVFCAIAHLVSIFPAIRGSEMRGGFCLSVAILSHYFFMTTFTWLTVMNFDLWLTFRSMRPVSKISKRFRRFRLYSGIGWGLPLCLIASFITVDEIYRDFTTEAVVPDYAIRSCFVATWSRGYYMYSLVIIALVINTIFVLWTFHIFYDFRKQNAHTFTNRRTTSDKYSVRLFIKLFCVMGMAWFIELISWYYNGETKPWVLVGLDCVMFLQALAIFLIFCVNRRTLKQLEEKYPSLKKIIGPIRMYKWFRAPSDADNVEMTTPGSTPRKLSLSVTTNTKIETLPRKASTSSVRSSASTKFHSNASTKMDSINLDSDSESEAQPMVVTHAPDLIKNT